MKQGKGMYIGYFWSPCEKEQQLRANLSAFGSTDLQRFENHTIKPPTYIKSNEFTEVF
jgi:hypothetical protein